MKTAFKLVIGLFGFIIMISGLIGLSNSFNTLEKDIDRINVKSENCFNWLDNLEAKENIIDTTTDPATKRLTTIDYEASLELFNKECL